MPDIPSLPDGTSEPIATGTLLAASIPPHGSSDSRRVTAGQVANLASQAALDNTSNFFGSQSSTQTLEQTIAALIATGGIQHLEEDPGAYSLAGLREQETLNITGGHHMQWADDGSRFFVGTQYLSSSVLKVTQYDTSTPWELAGSSSAGSSGATWIETSNGMFRVLENSMYDCHGSNPTILTRYVFGSPWDVTSISGGTPVNIPSPSASAVVSFFVSPDEEHLFTLDGDGNVRHYTFDTPGDVSSIEYVEAWNVNAHETGTAAEAPTYAFWQNVGGLPICLDMAADGSRLLLSGPAYLGGLQPLLGLYELGAAWDLSTVPRVLRFVRPYGARRCVANLSLSTFERCNAIWGDAGSRLYLFGFPSSLLLVGAGTDNTYIRLEAP